MEGESISTSAGSGHSFRDANAYQEARRVTRYTPAHRIAFGLRYPNTYPTGETATAFCSHKSKIEKNTAVLKKLLWLRTIDVGGTRRGNQWEKCLHLPFVDVMTPDESLARQITLSIQQFSRSVQHPAVT